MICASKPNRNFVDAFIAAQQNQKFSYPETGSSRKRAPQGYTVDHNRIQLGKGAGTFERAKNAVRQWKTFEMPWISLCWPQTPIETGATVAVLVSHLGFWSMNPCRIVYVVDEQEPLHRFGFAYGTLPAHSEIGEERFTVEMNPDDQTVWYDIYAFSCPGKLARLAYPFARILQKRFARDSMSAMKRVVQGQHI
jgi:uncharacterized protein (UPF0548 family)